MTAISWGSVGSLRSLYGEYAPAVRRHVMRMTAFDTQHVESIVQETFRLFELKRARPLVWLALGVISGCSGTVLGGGGCPGCGIRYRSTGLRWWDSPRRCEVHR